MNPRMLTENKVIDKDDKEKEYKVMSGQHLAALARQVTEKVNNGYKIYGKPFLDEDRYWRQVVIKGDIVA